MNLRFYRFLTYLFLEAREQRRANRRGTYLEAAAGVLECAGKQMRGTMIFQVHLEILSGQYRGLATMRTRNRKSAAFRMMSAERIEDKFFVTITTSDQPLGAFAQLVLTDVPPLHLHAAFILAIQRLVAACSRVLLQKVHIPIPSIFSLRCE